MRYLGTAFCTATTVLLVAGCVSPRYSLEPIDTPDAAVDHSTVVPRPDGSAGAAGSGSGGSGVGGSPGTDGGDGPGMIDLRHRDPPVRRHLRRGQ